jgi:hypothetical protein
MVPAQLRIRSLKSVIAVTGEVAVAVDAGMAEIEATASAARRRLSHAVIARNMALQRDMSRSSCRASRFRNTATAHKRAQ